MKTSAEEYNFLIPGLLFSEWCLKILPLKLEIKLIGSSWQISINVTNDDIRKCEEMAWPSEDIVIKTTVLLMSEQQ